MTDDPPTDESSLSHLSSQLIAAGFLSRPLELVSLFASSSSSSSSTATSEASYHRREERLKKETKAREQIVKCLWNMLASRLDEREGLEKAVTGLQVKEYELERMRASVDRAEKDKAIARKESEGDKARAKAAMKELEEEKEKYRRCREELAKAKSALGFVRTQAAHDLKRREVELSTTQTRFQRLTSESTHAQTRLVVLTPASPIAAPSFASRSGRRTSPTLPSPISSSASPAEVVFLEEALAHCEEERVRFAVENEELRNVVGEVVEWCDGAMELPGVGKVEREGAYVSESTWEGDESMSIPAPHASRPINAISPHLRSKLSHVRSRLETALDTTEDEVAKAREEVMDVLREEREERGREAGERRKLEGELAKATKVIEDGEELVKAFSTERFLAGIGTSDDTPVRSTVLPASTKLVAQAQSQVQAEDSRVAALIELSKSRAVAEAEKKKREAEEKRQKDVASFLDDLGLDSPAPVLEKEAMRSKDVRVEKKKEKEKSRTSTRGLAPPVIDRFNGQASLSPECELSFECSNELQRSSPVCSEKIVLQQMLSPLESLGMRHCNPDPTTTGERRYGESPPLATAVILEISLITKIMGGGRLGLAGWCGW
ncbi:Afadin/alpha-actinin-binding family protein [Pseudohyphozyma bogoriensis]|nr:Afadin/alpha-actinin-binding family protein [Pseudohyphozyma bogoriensis]